MEKRYREFLRQSAALRARVILLCNSMTQAEVARKLGISPQRVNQIIHPDRKRAREKVGKLVRYGNLLPARKLKCCDCGKQAKQYDHPDYARPEKVDPVCISCHMKRAMKRVSQICKGDGK